MEILHAIAILLLAEYLNTDNLVIHSFSLIEFAFMHSLLVFQGIQKVLFIAGIVEKLWLGTKSVAIYDSVAPVTRRCVNSIKLFASLRLLAGLCRTATALFSILLWCGLYLDQFIVDLAII